MMKVSSVRIVNFKSFSDTGEVSLGQVNVLIGRNNHGKSAFIRVIHLLQQGAEYNPKNLRLGALIKTPRDRKEEKRTSGVERVMVGDVRTAIVGVEHLPILEMGNEPLDRRAKRRDLRVVFLVGQG